MAVSLTIASILASVGLMSFLLSGFVLKGAMYTLKVSQEATSEAKSIHKGEDPHRFNMLVATCRAAHLQNEVLCGLASRLTVTFVICTSTASALFFLFS